MGNDDLIDDVDVLSMPLSELIRIVQELRGLDEAEAMEIARDIRRRAEGLSDT